MKRIAAHTLSLLLVLGMAHGIALATGALYVRPLNSNEQYRLMTIKTYDATVNIQDQIAVTHVDQVFTNRTGNRVESTFIFPLPDGAVITELIYWFNGLKYTASLRERQEAQQAYNERIRQRVDPALLQYFGDNVYKLNIAPIEPNSDVRFEITYAELLPYEFGAVSYRFPLKTTGLSPSPLERVSVRVDATTSRAFRSFTSPSHGNTAANGITRVSPSHYTVIFGDENFTPDRDLQLRYETRRSSIDINVLTYTPTPQDSFGVNSFYALWVTPPDSASTVTIPRNIVFTVDISSSMEGKRIEQLKDALRAFLDALDPRDKFNIVLFSTTTQPYRPDLVQATAEEIVRARRFVDEVGAAGLTNIDDALTRSLAMSYAEYTANTVVFMTDGYPTWGEQNLKAIADGATARNHGRVRIFPFGIGDEVSKELLGDIAQRNGGYPTYIAADDSIAATFANYFRRVSQPALTNLELDYGGLATYDRYPTTLPNLFWGNQVLQFGRYTNSGTFTLALHARQLNEPLTITNQVSFPDVPGGNRAVARLWAKYKIDYLLEQIRTYGEKKELVNAVIDLSIRFGILTPYTAFYSDPNTDHPTGVADREERLVPTRIVIEPNTPNPFTASTRIAYWIPAGGTAHAVVAIYDVAGKRVKTIVDGDMAPGRHETAWDGTDDAGGRVPAGVYICRVDAAGSSATQRLILIR